MLSSDPPQPTGKHPCRRMLQLGMNIVAEPLYKVHYTPFSGGFCYHYSSCSFICLFVLFQIHMLCM